MQRSVQQVALCWPEVAVIRAGRGVSHAYNSSRLDRTCLTEEMSALGYHSHSLRQCMMRIAQFCCKQMLSSLQAFRLAWMNQVIILALQACMPQITQMMPQLSVQVSDERVQAVHGSVQAGDGCEFKLLCWQSPVDSIPKFRELYCCGTSAVP